MISPWQDMKPNTQRRIQENIIHDFFWIVDMAGHYGFCIKIESCHQDKIDALKLKGISIFKKIKNNVTELFIGLHDHKDEDIFLTLCLDLIEISKKYGNSSVMLYAIETRLIRWQRFLLKNNHITFSLQQQMGLFSELLCLKNLIAKNIGFERAISSWVGADFDKQDFLLDNMVIEVKSYKTSKTPTVSISSAAQLYSDKQPLYLISYGLTPTTEKTGISIDDLIIEIDENYISLESTELFHDKLSNYGYMPGLNDHQHRFIVDNIMYFYVNESFPKIIPQNIDHRISNIKYSIDLLQCFEHKLEEINF